MKNQEEMKAAANKILTLATLLQSADERGDLLNMGDGTVSDVTGIIAEQAKEIIDLLGAAEQ